MSAKFKIGLIALGLLLTTGCGGGPRLGTVTGTVTVNGKPVTQGTIMFIPAEGKAAIGMIGPDGRYTLTTFVDGDGAMLGDHRVTIQATQVGPSSMAPATLEDEIAQGTGKTANRVLVAGRVTWIVPQRYSQLDSTTLTATVNSGPQTIDFDVPAQ